MSIKAKLEALVYAAEDPITLDQMAALLKDDLLALKDLPAPAPHPERDDGHLGAVEADEFRAEESLAEVSTIVDASSSSGDAAAPSASEAVEPSKSAAKKSKEKSEKVELRNLLKPFLEELIAEFNREDHGVEVFSKSLKPPIRLSLQSLETLAVIAYKQPVTVPEISDIRGVDSSGVIGTLLERKLITTAGRKAVVGRPMLYKTTKDFLLRFGLKDVSELPSLEEFEKLAAREMQDELFAGDHSAMADATGVPNDSASDEMTSEETTHEENAVHNNGHSNSINNDSSNEDGGMEQLAEDEAEAPQSVTEPTVSSDPKHNNTDEQVADQIASESSGG